MNESVPVPGKLLVVLPSWVGDAAMATPMLRALRSLYPETQITLLLKDYVRPVIDGSPWHDRLIVARPGKKQKNEGRRRKHSLVWRVRRRQFDAAVLLPNSFRSALLVSRAGIKRRIGYDRDGRGLLLTDRLIPMKNAGEYVPVSAVDYYLGLARYLGSQAEDRRLQLFTRPEDDERAWVCLASQGVQIDAACVYLNPGAATKKGLKNWPPQRFAQLADQLATEMGLTILLGGSSKERATLDAVQAAAKTSCIDLPGAGVDLMLAKSIMKRCELVVSNDTGARHLAAGLNVPLVSLFGPTDPRWSMLDGPQEKMIVAEDGKMASISVQQVRQACRALLDGERTAGIGSRV